MSSRHHYVSQFYLRQWCEGRQLFEYYRSPYTNELKYRKVAPRQTGFKINLNTLESEPLSDIDSDALENSIAKMEDEVAPALQCLVNDGVSAVSEEQKRTIAGFLLLQLERSPHRVDEAVNLAESLRREILLHASPEIRSIGEEYFTPEMAQNFARGRLVWPSPETEEWKRTLADFDWRVVESHGGFVTSDRPVLLDATGVAPGNVASMLSIALTPNHLLICTPQSWSNEIDHEWLVKTAGSFNGRLVEAGPRIVYSKKSVRSISGLNLEALMKERLRE